jgi:hypothetical protein
VVELERFLFQERPKDSQIGRQYVELDRRGFGKGSMPPSTQWLSRSDNSTNAQPLGAPVPFLVSIRTLFTSRQGVSRISHIRSSTHRLLEELKQNEYLHTA